MVKANFIYTRIIDTNTPINKSADLICVEKMWLERFGLDIIPLERMKSLLKKPEEWFVDIGNKNFAYHKKFPEFRIDFSVPTKVMEVYSFFFLNQQSNIYKASFKYNSTTLFELNFLTVDGMRFEIGIPRAQSISLIQQSNWYYYFNLSSLDGIFHFFLRKGKIDQTSRGEKSPFLFFNNPQEQKQFDEYLVTNQEEFELLDIDYSAIEAKEKMTKNGFNVNVDPFFMNKSKQMFEIWKNTL